ncbi:hypothetical protein B1992_05570 [Pseudoxanthomonas broegbernensis]|uniref:Uncharacterized protein n=1 Tax=Pseudoxanthomonas broegbernensis TaxID=83619 RepID=A0A7V8GN78_9GAMM|nr:hypothetical protein [Pseudoxanthomonas broegbernensis]KAF1686862.1 hypothetical protein B1992_05570 [Pseudoxanthomonas broegbernensis]MBB6065548.1 hypothetical protein [Pseudoxanthomonas broegbernensis]
MQHWIDQQDGRTQLIVVTDEAVYADRMTPEAAAQAVEAMGSGRSPAAVFGKGAKHVGFRAMTRVQYNEHETDIEFHHRDGKDDEVVSVYIGTPGLRERVYEHLRERLAGQFGAYQAHFSRWRAAFGSLLALTVFGLGTLLLRAAAIAVRAAGDMEYEGRRQGSKKLLAGLLDLLGPTGVSVIGGFLVVLAAVVLYSRLRDPQRLHILQATPYALPSPIVLGLKYAALGAVWLLALRVLF